MMLAALYALGIGAVMVAVAVGRLVARSIREVSKWDRRNG